MYNPMRRSAGELASQISRALISASNQTIPTRTWTPSLEQTLHRLGCRDSLSPTLVARVIDPFLLNHHSLALGFFDWASQQPNFSHTSLTYQSVLKSLSISRQFNAVEKLLRVVKSQKIRLQPSVYRSIIASQIIGKKTHIAFSIFNEVNSVITEIGPETCNSLLAALSSEGNLSCARKVFDEMMQSGVRFSTLGFGVFIWRFCGNFGLGETLGLLDEVRKSDFVGINGSIIAVFVVQGLCSRARVIEGVCALDELRNRECKPDFMAYRIVAEALREKGDVVGVEKVLKKKRKLGVAPRANDYRDFIFSLISERLICEAKELGKVITSGDFPIQDDILNALVGSASSIDPFCALSFLKFMLWKERFPTLLTLINLSRNFIKHGNVDELLEIFNDLSARDFFKDTESYNVMVSFMCTAGRVKEAYQVLQDMKKKGISPDVSTYNALLEACCREDLLRPAKLLWDEMFANRCFGNLKTYNILITKFSAVGDVEEAYRLFCHMLGKDITPDLNTYTSLLEGLCKAKDLETALQVFNKSVEQDMALAQTILRTFILCLCKEGYFLPASKLLRGCNCDVGHLDSHVTLLKLLANAGEVSLAMEHVEWIGQKSLPELRALHSELLSTLKSSSELDQILKFCEMLKENSLNSRQCFVQGHA